MYEVKPNVPSLGDNLEAGTHWPTNLPHFCKDYAAYAISKGQGERLRKELKLLLTVADVKRIKDLDKLSDDVEFVEFVRQRLLSVMDGFNNNESLYDLDREEFAEALHKRIADSFDESSETEWLEQRQEKVERKGGYADMADSLIDNAIRDYCPGHSFDLTLRSEIRATKNVGKLLTIAADSRWNDKARYEAKRKLILIDAFAKFDYELKQKKDHLEWFFDELNRRFFVQNGDKIGGTKKKYLISTHDLNDNNRCIGEPQLSDEPPASLAENQLVEGIDFRVFMAKLKDGREVKIPLMIDSREKELTRLVEKSMSNPDYPMERLLRDVNGLRILAESEEHLELCKQALREAFEEPDAETGETHTVEIDKPKNGVGDNGTGKKTIYLDKFNLIIDDKDFEFQALDLKEYANYQSLREEGGAWCLYKIKRFFRGSIFRTMWPKAHYPGIDADKMEELAIEQAYQKHWESRKILPASEPKQKVEIPKRRIKSKDNAQVSTIAQPQEEAEQEKAA